jgi:adenine-specific DNA-methyltransferase
MSSMTKLANPKFDLMVAALGKPYYERSGVALYCGDCIDLIARLNADTVDLIVTSPPYNIGKEYESVRPVADYIAWCSRWLALLHRVASPYSSFWLNLGYFEFTGKAKALPIAYLLWDKSPFYFLQEIIWNYGAGVAARRMFSPRNEKFLWFVKDSDQYMFNLDAVRDPDVKYPNQRKNGKLKCNPLGKNPPMCGKFQRSLQAKIDLLKNVPTIRRSFLLPSLTASSMRVAILIRL